MRCSTAVGVWVNDKGFSLITLHTIPDSMLLMHHTQGGVSIEAGSMVTILVPVLQDSVPESTLLVYHTLHIPQQVDKPDKWESDRYLYPHVAQMNAAGHHVARQLGYHILDMEAMALQLPKEAMMADITHPGAGFLMQVRLPDCMLSKVCLVMSPLAAAMICVECSIGQSTCDGYIVTACTT